MPLPALTCEQTSWRLEQPKNLLIPVHSSQECHCVFCTYSSSAVVCCLLDDVDFIKLAVVKLLTHIKFRLNVHFFSFFFSLEFKTTWKIVPSRRASFEFLLEFHFCRTKMTGWERMTSRCQGFLGEEVQNQKRQASNCGAKFSLLPRQMDLRYLIESIRSLFVWRFCMYDLHS